MKKKILSTLLAGMLMSVMLSGCGNTPVEEETDAATEEVSEEAAEEPEEPEEEAAPEETEEEPQQDMVTVYLPVKCTYVASDEESESTEFSGKEEYEYDDHGNLIKTTSYFWDENTVGSLSEVEYEYDDAGRILKEIFYETPYDYEGNAEGDRIKNAEQEHEYDDDGEILTSTRKEWFELSEDDIEYNLLPEVRVTKDEYDKNGRVVKETLLDYMPDDSEVTYIFTFEHEYDENGNIIKSTESRNDSDVKVVREYDEHGNQTEAYQVVPDDSGLTAMWEKCEYTYDEQGRVVEVLAYAHEILNENKYMTKYEYDENGNVIKVGDEWGGVSYKYVEMRIPDIKNYHKDNQLFQFDLGYIRI